MDGNRTENHNLFEANGPQARELSATALNTVSGGVTRSTPHVSEIVVTKDVDIASTN